MKCKEIKIGDVMDALIKMCGEPVYKVIGEDAQELIQEEVEKCNNYEFLKAIYAFVRRLNK